MVTSPEPTPERAPGPRGRVSLGLIVRDVHFWIPVVVLIGGLFVLQWMR